jgi:hypothetical protein
LHHGEILPDGRKPFRFNLLSPDIFKGGLENVVVADQPLLVHFQVFVVLLG